MVTLHSKLWKLCVCNAASTTALFPECELGLFYEWSYEWMGILSQKPIRTADNRVSGKCGLLSLTPQRGVLSTGWEEETHFFSHLPSITEAVRGTQVWHFAYGGLIEKREAEESLRIYLEAQNTAGFLATEWGPENYQRQRTSGLNCKVLVALYLLVVGWF